LISAFYNDNSISS